MYTGGDEMAEARLNIRIDADIKAQAEDILNKLGLTISSGVNIFLSKVVSEKGIPFPITLERSETIGYDAYRFEKAAVNMVREEIAGYIYGEKPVARYDDIKKRPYLEYPDGRREYTIEEE